MSINEMFTTATNATTTTTGSSALAGTAALTTVASQLANEAIQKISADFEAYALQFEESKNNHAAMDALLDTLVDYNAVDVSFLSNLDETTIEGMLKSQQSKRSRSKSKAMTMENYKSYMTGSIAENIIRHFTGKKKHSGAGRSGSTEAFTDDQLVALKDDQEKLRKELRNVQSKKSILKAKADFSEQDERWATLLHMEDQLKGIRDDAPRVKTVSVDTTKEALLELLKDVEIGSLKAAESKALLENIVALIA